MHKLYIIFFIIYYYAGMQGGKILLFYYLSLHRNAGRENILLNTTLG